MDSHLLFATQAFVSGLQGLCALSRIPFVQATELQQVRPPFDLNSLRQAVVLSRDGARVHYPVDVAALERFARFPLFPRLVQAAQHARAQA